jgi:hypothetical protein
MRPPNTLHAQRSVRLLMALLALAVLFTTVTAPRLALAQDNMGVNGMKGTPEPSQEDLATTGDREPTDQEPADGEKPAGNDEESHLPDCDNQVGYYDDWGSSANPLRGDKDTEEQNLEKTQEENDRKDLNGDGCIGFTPTDRASDPGQGDGRPTQVSPDECQAQREELAAAMERRGAFEDLGDGSKLANLDDEDIDPRRQALLDRPGVDLNRDGCAGNTERELLADPETVDDNPQGTNLEDAPEETKTQIEDTTGECSITSGEGIMGCARGFLLSIGVDFVNWLSQRTADAGRELSNLVFGLPNVQGTQIGALYEASTSEAKPAVLVGILILALLMTVRGANYNMAYAAHSGLPKVIYVMLALAFLPEFLDIMAGIATALGMDVFSEQQIGPALSKMVTDATSLNASDIFTGGPSVETILVLIALVPMLGMVVVVLIVSLIKQMFYVLLVVTGPYALICYLFPGLNAITGAWFRGIVACAVIPLLYALEIKIGTTLVSNSAGLLGDGTSQIVAINVLITLILLWVMWKTPFKVLEWAFQGMYSPGRGLFSSIGRSLVRSVVMGAAGAMAFKGAKDLSWKDAMKPSASGADTALNAGQRRGRYLTGDGPGTGEPGKDRPSQADAAGTHNPGQRQEGAEPGFRPQATTSGPSMADASGAKPSVADGAAAPEGAAPGVAMDAEYGAGENYATAVDAAREADDAVEQGVFPLINKEEGMEQARGRLNDEGERFEGSAAELEAAASQAHGAAVTHEAAAAGAEAEAEQAAAQRDLHREYANDARRSNDPQSREGAMHHQAAARKADKQYQAARSKAQEHRQAAKASREAAAKNEAQAAKLKAQGNERRTQAAAIASHLASGRQDSPRDTVVAGQQLKRSARQAMDAESATGLGKTAAGQAFRQAEDALQTSQAADAERISAGPVNSTESAKALGRAASGYKAAAAAYKSIESSAQQTAAVARRAGDHATADRHMAIAQAASKAASKNTSQAWTTRKEAQRANAALARGQAGSNAASGASAGGPSGVSSGVSSPEVSRSAHPPSKSGGGAIHKPSADNRPTHRAHADAPTPMHQWLSERKTRQPEEEQPSFGNRARRAQASVNFGPRRSANAAPPPAPNPAQGPGFQPGLQHPEPAPAEGLPEREISPGPEPPQGGPR